MIYIFFIASFNAFFFLILLLRKTPKASHDKLLMFWLMCLGVSVAWYGSTMNVFDETPILSSGIIATFLLHGPFMYLYVSDLTSDHKSYHALKLSHFLPFIAFIIYLVISAQFPEYARGISVEHSENLSEPPLLFVFFLIITALSGTVYFFLAFRKYKSIKRSSENYSAKDNNLEWLGKLITIFGIVWTLLIIVAVIHHIFHLFTIKFCTNGLFLSLSAFIILIGYYGLNQKEVFINFKSENDNNKLPTSTKELKEHGAILKDEGLEKCFRDVESFMITEKPYLDPELTLPKLAKDLDVPAHQLSQVINEIHQRNFFDFINQYRVEEVKNKIQDEQFKNYSLLAIAYDSGFNSKSAFNRVFKKITSMTPSQFKNSVED